MLKLRIITALVLGPLVIWSVLGLSHQFLAYELAAILCIGAWEWARLAGITHQLGRIGFALFVAGLLWLLAYFLHQDISILNPVLYFAGGFWLFALFSIVYFNRSPVTTVTNLSVSARVITLLVGACLLLSAFVALTALHRSYGANYVLVLLVLIWIADSGAYFAGKAFGKHKLAMNVSPGKTWEGVAGAIVGTVIAGYLISLLLNIESANIIYFILVAVVTVALSIVGDLIESLFKRRSGVKDSSQILPGHGGILDRIDSLIAAAPIFLLGLISMGSQ